MRIDGADMLIFYNFKKSRRNVFENNLQIQ